MQVSVTINGTVYIMCLKDAAALADIMGRAKATDRRYIGRTYESQDERFIASAVEVNIATGRDVATMTRAEFDRENDAFNAAKEAAEADEAAA